MRSILPWAVVACLVIGSSASAQLVPRDGSPALAVKSHRVEATVEDGLAETRVRQTFINTFDRPLEAIYLFPLPEGAALVDVAMEVGGQRLEGLLAERKQARKVYDDIVRTKRDPALVEQIGRNRFRLSVFPVVPHEETVVEIAWIQHVPLEQGGFRYEYPLAAAGQRVAAPQDLTFTVTFRSSAPLAEVIASRDDVQVVRVGEFEATAALEVTDTEVEGDLVVTARVEAPTPTLAVKTYRACAGEDGWFVATITPPRPRADEQIPRDVTLVLDTSGSMGANGKIEQAKASALWLLEHLRPVDRVNVIRFSSDVEALHDAPVDATPENCAALAAWVEGFRAKGSTAFGDALARALRAPVTEGRVSTIVLLTDGRPTIGEQDPVKLVEMAKRGGEQGVRVFPFGVGSDAQAGLLRGVAAAGRGKAEIFRPGGEIAARLTSFLARTAAPVLAAPGFAVDGVPVHDVLPRPLPDAYLGEQLTITGRYRGAGLARVSVTATVGQETKILSRVVDFPPEAGDAEFVPKLFARQKLDLLEEAQRLRLGLDDDAYYAALDRGAYSTTEEIVDEMIDVSLGHGVQCAYTSFLVLLPEDRHRLDARDLAAVKAALERARRSTGVDGASESAGEAREVGVHDPGEGDPDYLSDSPFDSDAFNDVIGLGGGVGGKYGGRFAGRRNSRTPGGRAITVIDIPMALKWLARHQEAEGRWDADGFMTHDPADDRGDGAGGVGHDIGETALALLAFLGDGHTMTQGPHQDQVALGIKWLRSVQDPATGFFRDGTHPPCLRDHALATFALGEAYYFSRSPLTKRNLQRAVAALESARSADGEYRCASIPATEPDAATSGWAVLALASARDAGAVIDEPELSRLCDRLLVLPSEDSSPSPDRMRLAAGLFGKFLLGHDPAIATDMEATIEFLAAHPPQSSPGPSDLDSAGWFFGACAMFQAGGRPWGKWAAALEKYVPKIERDGASRGSRNPVPGVGDHAGGRVACTALFTLCRQIEYRYARILGGR